jgi:hypothetical protein
MAWLWILCARLLAWMCGSTAPCGSLFPVECSCFVVVIFGYVLHSHSYGDWKGACCIIQRDLTPPSPECFVGNTHVRYRSRMQCEKSTLEPIHKKPRQGSGAVDVQVMKATLSCTPSGSTAPDRSQTVSDTDHSADRAPEVQTQLRSKRMNDTSGHRSVFISQASVTVELDTKSRPPSNVDRRGPGRGHGNTVHPVGSGDTEVADSGHRNGGGSVVLISGATFSAGSPQKHQDECQNLYQQLIVGRRSSEKPAVDEADSCIASNRHTLIPSKITAAATAAATSRALHSVLQKAKVACRAGTAGALPSQPKPSSGEREESEPKSHVPSVLQRAAAIAPVAKRNSRRQQQPLQLPPLPDNSAAMKAKFSEPTHGGHTPSTNALPTAARRSFSGKVAATLHGGHKQTLQRPNNAAPKRRFASPDLFIRFCSFMR